MPIVPDMLFGGFGVFCEEISVLVTSDWSEPRIFILLSKPKGSLIPWGDIWRT
jgi:hypothetical protein